MGRSAVVRANAARIWDIGDAEYPLVADFVNELPMDQLAEIEVNSPVSLMNRHRLHLAGAAPTASHCP
jgi:hypothetical protein